MMNTGKIVMGFSLVMISIAMMVSPSGATGPADPSNVGGGIAWSMEPGDPADLHTGRTVLSASACPLYRCHIPVRTLNTLHIPDPYRTG